MRESEEEIENLLKGLEQTYQIVKYKALDTFLGIEIIIEKDRILLNKNIIVYEDKNRTEENKKTKNFPCREAIGRLLYLSNKTRPDISYAVNYESRKMENPSSLDISNQNILLKLKLCQK